MFIGGFQLSGRRALSSSPSSCPSSLCAPRFRMHGDVGDGLSCVVGLHAVPASEIKMNQPRFCAGRSRGHRKFFALAPEPISLFHESPSFCRMEASFDIRGMPATSFLISSRTFDEASTSRTYAIILRRGQQASTQEVALGLYLRAFHVPPFRFYNILPAAVQVVGEL